MLSGASPNLKTFIIFRVALTLEKRRYTSHSCNYCYRHMRALRSYSTCVACCIDRVRKQREGRRATRDGWARFRLPDIALYVHPFAKLAWQLACPPFASVPHVAHASFVTHLPHSWHASSPVYLLFWLDQSDVAEMVEQISWPGEAEEHMPQADEP